MTKNLLPLIPEHKIYVEVFGGGASLLFAKKPSRVEIYNDIDSGLYNFFRILRDNFEEFKAKVDLTLYSREHYNYCKSTWESCEDDVEKAYRWFCVARMSFGGIFKSGWGYSINSSEAILWNTLLKRLTLFKERIKSVQIEHQDFKKILKIYDTADTFFYLDPPYVLSTRYKKYYKNEMEDQDHRDLIEILPKLKGKVLLSGYGNGIYDSLNWKVKEFITQLNIKRNRKNDIRVEKVWYNYNLSRGKLF